MIQSMLMHRSWTDVALNWNSCTARVHLYHAWGPQLIAKLSTTTCVTGAAECAQAMLCARLRNGECEQRHKSHRNPFDPSSTLGSD